MTKDGFMRQVWNFFIKHGKKSVVVTAKLFFATIKRLAGNERANEGISRNQPK